jgi:hypothetical protein
MSYKPNQVWLFAILFAAFFLNAGSALLPAQPPISPDEARRCLSAYLEYAEANPGGALTECFEPDIRKKIERGEVAMMELIFKTRILSVDPPEALVLASTENEGRWDRLLRFRFTKKGGQVFLQPMVERTWIGDYATSYHDETEIRMAFSEEERRQWREQWKNRLASQDDASSESPPDSLLRGEWALKYNTFWDNPFVEGMKEGELLRFEPGGSVIHPSGLHPPGDWAFAGNQLALRIGKESVFYLFQLTPMQNGDWWCSAGEQEGFLLARPGPENDVPVQFPELKGFKVLCQPAYDEMKWFSRGFSCVRRGEKFGFLDSRGRESIPCEYTFAAMPLFNDLGQILVGREGHVWLIDTSGQVLRTYECDKAWQLWEGILLVEKAGKKGLLDTAGHVVLPLIYDEISAGGWDYFRVLKDTGWGLYDREGKEILPPEFEGIDFREDNLAVVKSKGSYGVMDIFTRQWLVPCAYDKITLKGAPLIQAVRNGKTSLFRLDGTLLSDREYELTTWMGWDYMAFQSKGRRGVLNGAGAVVIPPVYNNVFYANLRERGLFQVTLNDVTVVRDSAGAIYPDSSGVFDEEPDEALLAAAAEPNEFGDWYRPFQHNGWYGYQLPDGRWMIPPLFDSAGKFVDGLAAVIYKGRGGLIDAWGREVLPFLCDDIEIDEDAGWIFVKYKGKWGVLAKTD